MLTSLVIGPGGTFACLVACCYCCSHLTSCSPQNRKHPSTSQPARTIRDRAAHGARNVRCPRIIPVSRYLATDECSEYHGEWQGLLRGASEAGRFIATGWSSHRWLVEPCDLDVLSLFQYLYCTVCRWGWLHLHGLERRIIDTRLWNMLGGLNG